MSYRVLLGDLFVKFRRRAAPRALVGLHRRVRGAGIRLQGGAAFPFLFEGIRQKEMVVVADIVRDAPSQAAFPEIADR